MTDFSSWKLTVTEVDADRDRKKDFVDKLKGKTRCCVNPSAPNGVVFTICNEVTQHMQTISKINGKWSIWGTETTTFQMTDIELEEYLSEQLDIIFENGDDSKMLRMMDGWGIVEWY